MRKQFERDYHDFFATLYITQKEKIVGWIFLANLSV